MIYATIRYGYKPRKIVVSKVKTRPKGTQVVVLNGIFVDGKLEKTGEYCPISYDKPVSYSRQFVFEPPRGWRDHYDQR